MSQLVFVTGASGFLGSHIVDDLLRSGYRVRAAVRAGKLAQLTAAYAQYGDRFEPAVFPDIATSQVPDAFVGVDALIHTAGPIAVAAATPEERLKGSIEGALNVIRQAVAAGVTRVVYTSSIATVRNTWSAPGQAWNPITLTIEGAVSASGLAGYMAAKTIAERELWAFADAHPAVDVTSINPPFIYGPYAPGHDVPPGNVAALSTNIWIYRLLTPLGTCVNTPGYADVRDVARAHVLALTAPPATAVGRKGFPIASPYGLDFQDVLDYIARMRPALAPRLLGPDKIKKFSYDRITVDFRRIEDVLGLRREDYHRWEDTILATVDDLLRIEQEWENKGHSIPITGDTDRVV